MLKTQIIKIIILLSFISVKNDIYIIEILCFVLFIQLHSLSFGFVSIVFLVATVFIFLFFGSCRYNFFFIVHNSLDLSDSGDFANVERICSFYKHFHERYSSCSA